MGSVFDVSVSGLVSMQRAMQVVTNNIANVNTEGYSRQDVGFTNRAPNEIGIGEGVDLTNVRRIYDQFVTERLRETGAAAGFSSTYTEMIGQIDTFLADPSGGLGTSLNEFFEASQNVADDPASIPARRVFLEAGEALESRFKFVNNRLAEVGREANSRINVLVGEINSYTDAIADLNAEITEAFRGGNTGLLAGLEDKRDLAISELSKRIGIQTVDIDDGGTSIFTTEGQTLVLGGRSIDLTVMENEFDGTRFEVAYGSGASARSISDQIEDGQLGGLLTFREEIVDLTQMQIGQIGAAFAMRVNEQHNEGLDLNGNFGGDIFTVATPVVSGSDNNDPTSDSPSVSFLANSADDIQRSNYELSYDLTADEWTVTRLSDGTSTVLDAAVEDPFRTDEYLLPNDGLRIDLSGIANVADGDSYLIRPNFNGAASIDFQLTDPTELATAVPIRTLSNESNLGTAEVSAGEITNIDAIGSVVNAGNTGTGAITAPTVTDATNDNISNTVRVVFTGANTYDVIDDTDGQTLATGLTYVDGNAIPASTDGWDNGWQVTLSGAPAVGDEFEVHSVVTNSVRIVFNDPPTTYDVIDDTEGTTLASAQTYTSTDSIPPTGASWDNGWSVEISGSPTAGDVFNIELNANGFGDNRNILELAKLQGAKVLNGEQTSFVEAYSSLVGEVGAFSRQAQINNDAQTGLLAQMEQQQQAVAGVSLDEEAVKLMQFQQTYQASAQAVSIARSLIDTLFQAVR